MVEPERQAILMDIIECSSPESDKKKKDCEEELGSPKPLRMVDPVQSCIEMTRKGGNGPMTTPEIIELLGVLNHPFHVNTLTMILTNELSNDTLETILSTPHFYVMSAVLSCCLAYCLECLDYASAQNIMKLSHALSTVTDNSIDPENKTSAGLTLMSTRIHCHPFWNQRHFWISRFQEEIAEGKKELSTGEEHKALSTEAQDHADGAVSFNVLNRTVQFMLSFGLKEVFVADFVEQTMEMRLYREDYRPMIKEMISFFRGGGMNAAADRPPPAAAAGPPK